MMQVQRRIPAATVLHKIVDPLIFGIKRQGTPQPFAKIETLQEQLNKRNFGYSWNNKNFEAHCYSGEHNLYYYSRFQIHFDDKCDDELMPEDCIMPYFDIDIQKSAKIGTNENAQKAIKYLETYFPELYSEENRRAYPLFYNDGYNKEDIKAIFKKLENILNVLLIEHTKIEKFEIKGLFTEIYRQEKWIVKGYAQLGKLPTQLLNRLDEFYRQPIMRISTLEQVIAKLEIKLEKFPKKEKVKRTGSISGQIISDKQAQEYFNQKNYQLYKTMAWRCMDLKTEQANGHKVTHEDFIINFIILSIFAKYPNPDGQLPKARIQILWKYLYQQGFIQRGWDNSRYRVIRNTMSDCGYLSWQSNKYWFYQKDKKDGTRKNGKAMQWALKEEYTIPKLNAQPMTSIGAVLPECPVGRVRPWLVLPGNDNYNWHIPLEELARNGKNWLKRLLLLE